MGADDRALIRAARQQDVGAFEELIARCGKEFLMRVSMKIMRNETAAQDAVQEALATAWTSLPRFRGNTVAEFKAWMIVVVRSSCLVILRRDRRERVLRRYGYDETAFEAVEDEAATAELTEILAESHVRYLAGSIRTKFEQRKQISDYHIFIARAFGGATFQTLADDPDLPDMNADQWHNHWRQRIRPLLQEAFLETVIACRFPGLWDQKYLEMFAIRVAEARPLSTISKMTGRGRWWPGRSEPEYGPRVRAALDAMSFSETLAAVVARPNFVWTESDWSLYGAFVVDGIDFRKLREIGTTEVLRDQYVHRLRPAILEAFLELHYGI